MDIENRIRAFILTNLYYSEDSSLGDEDSFLATGVVDSMGVMELVGFIQSEFGVNPAQRELVVENFDSIRKLADFIRRKLSLQQPPAQTEATKPSAALNGILNPG